MNRVRRNKQLPCLDLQYMLRETLLDPKTQGSCFLLSDSWTFNQKHFFSLVLRVKISLFPLFMDQNLLWTLIYKTG